jgi:hypothetical protein
MATLMPEVSNITGLDNYNLTGQASFDKSTGDMIRTFPSRLTLPVCLVTHNGNIYDLIGEFDNEMEIDEKKSNEASKNQLNEKSININN